MFPMDHEQECSFIGNRIQALTLNCKSEIDEPNPLYAGNSECYYSIGSVNSNNSESICKFQQERLKCVLEQFQRERQDYTFSRNCLFCKKHFIGNRTLLLSHLMEQHNFVIGAPDNVVFIKEFLDILEKMLVNLQCFYCEKIFKDWITLKEHMRKKQHKQINPNNRNFDRFYLINYLEPGKRWVDVKNENDDFWQDSDEKEMEIGQDEHIEYVCLFCDSKSNDIETVWFHMKDDHMFDFKELKKQHKLSFYSQIKVINYIRRKVFDKECFCCDEIFTSHDNLIKHMTETNHITVLPIKDKWDQSMFYFSTFENDNILCALDVEDTDYEDEKMVFPEEPNFSITNSLIDPQFIKLSQVEPH